MKKILLIEDDKTLRENTRELLELENFKVYTAEDGLEGVELAQIQKPHLIICDILMPKMDGFEVLKKISGMETLQDTPFIFLSAMTESKDVRRGMNLGADDYITKPFDEKELVLAIRSRLAKHALLHRKKNQKASLSEMNSLAELEQYFKEYGESFEVEKNEKVYYERKHANFVFLLKSGLVKAHRMDEYGKELITGLYKKSDFFGYYHFLNHSSYPETATALETSYIFRLSSLKFQDILNCSQHLTLELAQLLSDNLSVLKNHLLEMAYSSVLKKTTSTILQFAEIMRENNEDGIKISRNDLASVAGISTESFIRSLSSLKKDGLIDIEGRNIRILNLEKLESIK